MVFKHIVFSLSNDQLVDTSKDVRFVQNPDREFRVF
jgi:hypothetical protein